MKIVLYRLFRYNFYHLKKMRKRQLRKRNPKSAKFFLLENIFLANLVEISVNTFLQTSKASMRFQEKELRSNMEGNDHKISIWWDYENCSLPFKAISHKAIMRFRTLLTNNGFNGPAIVHAYCDANQLPARTAEGLSRTGVIIHHIPSGKAFLKLIVFPRKTLKLKLKCEFF